jgi:hypothetical protein
MVHPQSAIGNQTLIVRLSLHYVRHFSVKVVQRWAMLNGGKFGPGTYRADRLVHNSSVPLGRNKP